MLHELVRILLTERGDLPSSASLTEPELERQFRALCNIRPPKPPPEGFLELQDQYLSNRARSVPNVDPSKLTQTGRISLWQGDITTLATDAIVNAGNAAMLGCFQPLHNCIDNVIHTASGVQVRLSCDRQLQGRHCKVGEVVTTEAYNLPSRYIFHTVGPIVGNRRPTAQDARGLSACYRTCLDHAEAMKLNSIAFCCIATGVYGYPQEQAAQVAIQTVRDWLASHPTTKIHIVFNVFTDADRRHYATILH